MKKLIALLFSFILLVNISFAQVANTNDIIQSFCEIKDAEIKRMEIVEDSVLFNSYQVIDIGSGDIFYNGLKDIIAVMEEISSGERFMVAFKSDSSDQLSPHSFEFTKIPCGDCAGIAGGFYDIKIKKHVIEIPIIVGSRMGSETILKYRFNKDLDLIELIGKDYEEYDRATGDISNKTSTNYLTGDHIEHGKKSKINVEQRESFTNCMVFEEPAEGPKLFVFGAKQSMYMEPSKKSEEIVSISYGQPVTLLESKGNGWVVVEYGHMSGFMNADCLLPVPPPMQDRKGIEMYMRNIPEIELTHELSDENGFVYEKAWLHEYGLTYIERFFKMSKDYIVMEQHLKVDSLSLYQGWLLACAMINELDRTLPVIGENKIFDDSNYQIITVKKIDGGIEIFYPERAD